MFVYKDYSVLRLTLSWSQFFNLYIISGFHCTYLLENDQPFQIFNVKSQLDEKTYHYTRTVHLQSPLQSSTKMSTTAVTVCKTT